jgi:hypothetical protein
MTMKSSSVAPHSVNPASRSKECCVRMFAKRYTCDLISISMICHWPAALASNQRRDCDERGRERRGKVMFLVRGLLTSIDSAGMGDAVAAGTVATRLGDWYDMPRGTKAGASALGTKAFAVGLRFAAGFDGGVDCDILTTQPTTQNRESA